MTNTQARPRIDSQQASRVEAILRDVAQREILPRFGRLALRDIIEKGPGLDAMREQAASGRRMVEWPEHNTWAGNLYRIRLVLMLRALAVLTSNNVMPKRPTDAVIHHYRNNLALAGLHGTDRDVVMAWGGRHVAVVEADLVSHGYVWQSDDWHTVGRLPSVRRAVWNMLLRRAPADEIRDSAATAAPTVGPESSDERENAAMSGR
jgi:hypothetical protein